jgi:hypothetical protein
LIIQVLRVLCWQALTGISVFADPEKSRELNPLDEKNRRFLDALERRYAAPLTQFFRRPLPSSPGVYQALADRPRSIALQFSVRN